MINISVFKRAVIHLSSADHLYPWPILFCQSSLFSWIYLFKYEILQDQVVDDVNLMICKIKYELSVSDDHDDLVNLLGWVSSKPACLMRASENTSGPISERYAQSSKELQDVKDKLLRRIMKLRKDNENKTAVEPATRDLNEKNKQLMTKKLV